MAARYTYTYGDGPGGSSCLRIGLTALPCSGVALRLSAVIDCTPGKDRMPPVTVDFLKNLPLQQREAEAPAAVAAQVTTGRFTCSSGDFLLVSQIQRVEAMVAAAGLPRECALSVEEFFRLSASNAVNTFYKAMAITVEAGALGSIVVDEHQHEHEELPPGAVVGECAICYNEYLVGGATSVKLLCGHTFHRRCMDRWTAVNRTCPYCRAPVPEEKQDCWDEDDYCDDSVSEYDEEDDGASTVPGRPQ
ncbi:Putative RING zinc finger domain superfamily protein [Zea mays]|jgi:hypothetical protein|uniref:Putative RING zinc finger domain superfamily protein n=2 Tax=Zea mays TaxID=4577 RepID=K7U5Z6_MAIZE|nr:Putative RING zinc finger domain superfamily protein [Zea mays]